jgi:hypothetical protein
MATKKKHVKAVIQLRRATEAEWIHANPILRLGEPAFSTDVTKLKIGTGTAHWSEIPYLMQSEYEEIMELIEHGMYTAGNGITLDDRVIALDDLILDCGTSTTNI